MNLDHSILTLLTFTPLAGAVLLAFLPDKGKTMRWAALAITLFTFAMTLHLPAHYIHTPGGYAFERNSPWIDAPPIRYHMRLDGLSMWLIVLTAFLAPLLVLLCSHTL